MAASSNQRPEDTIIAKAGADTSPADVVNSRTPLSRFTDTALTTSQDSFAREKERAQGSVDMKGLGLHKFQIAENASATSAPISIENPFAEKSISGRHVEARTYEKSSVKDIPNPFDQSVRFEPTKPVEKVPSPQVTAPVEVARPVAPPLERPRFDMEHPFEQPAKSVELHNLRNGSGQRETADAVLRVPANFDPTKPIHLVVYNHGYGDTASSSYANAKLDQQFHDAPPNTILIVPEWQASPASRTGADGRFGEHGRFKNLVDEAFSKTPGLQGLNTNNIDSIALIGHSAGFKGVERELYNNGLSKKVNSITMLDAMYDPTGMDPWLRNNIQALSDGSKRFVNVSNDTFPQSRAQAGRIKEMLRAAGLPSSNVYEDYNNSGSVMDLNKLQQHSIAFKYSEATVPGKGEHMSIPNLYVRRVTLAGL
ncbi:MAG: hypothetical protein P4L53_07325 [Candidatus Obscuribacterales bacterium]|nr:hypothetical protein [Candidatus Obscuribacterales bacterium]